MESGGVSPVWRRALDTRSEAVWAVARREWEGWGDATLGELGRRAADRGGQVPWPYGRRERLGGMGAGAVRLLGAAGILPQRIPKARPERPRGGKARDCGMSESGERGLERGRGGLALVSSCRRVLSSPCRPPTGVLVNVVEVLARGGGRGQERQGVTTKWEADLTGKTGWPGSHSGAVAARDVLAGPWRKGKRKRTREMRAKLAIPARCLAKCQDWSPANTGAAIRIQLSSLVRARGRGWNGRRSRGAA